MHAFKLVFHCAAIAAACIALSAQAAESAIPSSGSETGSSPVQSALPVQPMGPSANNDKFRQLRTQCETEVPSGKAHGDICVNAAAILVSDDLPDEFREANEEQRIKIALRLLERGVDSSNLARGRAFDYYNKIGFLGVNSYTDAIRARELMDMMIKSGYVGGELRKIRSNTTIISFGASEADKRQGCDTAKKWLSEGKLDVDSVKIARDVAGSNVCVGYDQAPK